jgi:hypothetical protein
VWECAGWKGLAALAVVVAGALGGFAVYTFGWHDSSGRDNATITHGVITLRDGDVIVRPSAATQCEASGEGGKPNLFCTRLHGGRHQVIFYSDSVLVWPLDCPRCGPDGPVSRYLWTPYVLGASRDRQAIGNLELRSRRHSVTYEDAIKAFGRPTLCGPLGADTAIAIWRPLRLRLWLATLGGLPSGKNGCEAPDAIYIHSAQVVGKQWQTATGLRVGLPAEVIRELYPNAIFQRQPRGDWPAPAYWLIHTRTPCIGACGSRYVTVPRLSAYVKAGRIAGFFFPVGAEGE